MSEEVNKVANIGGVKLEIVNANVGSRNEHGRGVICYFLFILFLSFKSLLYF